MKSLTFLFAVLINLACNQRNAAQLLSDEPKRIIPGGCEDCELLYEGLPSRLSHIDTVIDFYENAPRMLVEGIVYQSDAKTPAKAVIVYMYHTDQTGRYTTIDTQTLGKRHGHIRGWAKTNELGEYRFYTTRPAPYPDSQTPAHIHMLIKEPDTNVYWIDDILFTDDKSVTDSHKARLENRGGSGVCAVAFEKDDLQHCKRDIVLGLNVPGYPK